jgi:hypothetical protein
MKKKRGTPPPFSLSVTEEGKSSFQCCQLLARFSGQISQKVRPPEKIFGPFLENIGEHLYYNKCQVLSVRRIEAFSRPDEGIDAYVDMSISIGYRVTGKKALTFSSSL